MTVDALRRARLRSDGSLAWLNGIRTASGSRVCARPPTCASTRQAVAQARRSRYSGSIGQSRHETAEDAQARIAATAAGLLGLVGMTDVQPHSREQALISAILQSRPAEGDADLRVARPADSTPVRSSVLASSISRRSTPHAIARTSPSGSTASLQRQVSSSGVLASRCRPGRCSSLLKDVPASRSSR